MQITTPATAATLAAAVAAPKQNLDAFVLLSKVRRCAKSAHTIRRLSRIMRGSDDVRIGDAVLFEEIGAPAQIAIVAEMLQVNYAARVADEIEFHSAVRLWCTECRAALLGVVGTVQVDPSGESCTMLVRFERVQVTVMALSHVNELGYEVYS